MYADVKGINLGRSLGGGAVAGAGAETLPVTGALDVGWLIVAAVVLVSVGVALVSMARVLRSRRAPGVV